MTAVPSIDYYAPGEFCGVELAAADTAAAKRFYGRLFDWEFYDEPMDGGGSRTNCSLKGVVCAAMRRAPEGVAPAWLLYVAIDDIDAVAARAPALGGAVVPGPDASGDRIAVLRDPDGAVLALWERGAEDARLAGGAGALCWGELATPNPESALAFYSRLLPWRPDTKGDYTEWIACGAAIGGMLEMQDVEPRWLPYFEVLDCAETVADAKSLGGNVEFGPSLIERTGRFALLSDPQGALFYVIEMNVAA